MPTQSTRIQRVCEQCGAAFSARRDVVAIGKGRFCSNACRSLARRVPLADRFWAKVRKAEGDGCWEWTAFRNAQGYGAFGTGDRSIVAHRVSWELANGPIPPGLLGCHRCDNPCCVRPDHLWLGTIDDNMADRDAKGRQVALSGESHGMAKLTEEDVRSIRARHAAGGVTLAALGREHGVHISTIFLIVHRKKWRHLD